MLCHVSDVWSVIGGCWTSPRGACSLHVVSFTRHKRSVQSRAVRACSVWPDRGLALVRGRAGQSRETDHPARKERSVYESEEVVDWTVRQDALQSLTDNTACSRTSCYPMRLLLLRMTMTMMLITRYAANVLSIECFITLELPTPVSPSAEGARTEMSREGVNHIDSAYWLFRRSLYNKCMKHQFIRLLTVMSDWHFENSKNHKKLILSNIILTVRRCDGEWYHLFMIFAVFEVSVIARRR